MSDPQNTGRRRDNPDSLLPENGDYGRDRNGDWFGMTPNGHLANLRLHNVVEHEDGTISVEPSIKLSYPGWGTDAGIRVTSVEGAELWHGYLQRGIWREA